MTTTEYSTTQPVVAWSTSGSVPGSNVQQVKVTEAKVAKPAPKATAPKANQPAAAQEAKAGREYSGMYSFLKDGEFVQITVEEAGADASNPDGADQPKKNAYRRPWMATVFHVSQTDPITAPS